MKKLVLHVATNFRLAEERGEMLQPLCNVSLATPEQATFQFLQARFDAVVICNSVPARKLLPLVKFLRTVKPALPLILLRTGRERAVCYAHYRVPVDDQRALMIAVEMALEPAMAAKSNVSRKPTSTPSASFPVSV
jgi:hypothetical protein